jgi:F-type H+-transporting ATPase subunit c
LSRFSKEKGSVNRFAKLLFWGLGLTVILASPVLAAAPGSGESLIFSKYFGVGLTVVGAAYGIGKLASSAYEGMSRQPEVAGNIQTAMIIAAALIEGFTFFALFICMQY